MKAIYRIDESLMKIFCNTSEFGSAKQNIGFILEIIAIACFVLVFIQSPIIDLVTKTILEVSVPPLILFRIMVARKSPEIKQGMRFSWINPFIRKSSLMLTIYLVPVMLLISLLGGSWHFLGSAVFLISFMLSRYCFASGNSQEFKPQIAA